MIRPLYISPVGRGGVDFGIQNITRAVRRYGAPRAELLRLPEIYNFIPALIPRGLPRGWWKGFDLIQGRSRVAFALRAPGRPLVTTVHHLTTDPDLQPYSTLAQRLFYRLVESRYDWWSISSADAVVCVSRYTQQQVARTYGYTNTTIIYDGIDTDVFVPPPDLKRRDDGLPDRGGRIRLLFVGNRTRRKGLTCCRAFLIACQKRMCCTIPAVFKGAMKARRTRAWFQLAHQTATDWWQHISRATCCWRHRAWKDLASFRQRRWHAAVRS
jgi:Glycosyltransferase